jgi:hypothetical protein
MPDSWLETELSRQLCPVSAPDALWQRIHEQRRPLRVRQSPWMTWSIATACLLILFAGLVWRFGVHRNPSADLETLAAREMHELANGSGQMDIRSGDPTEIRNWVKANSDIDLQLPRNSAFWKDAVRLVGARILRSAGSSVVVVGYRAGKDFAVMLVEDRRARLARSASPGHTSLRANSTGAAHLYSWSLGADDYAIAFSGTKDSERACLLCHANSPAMLVLSAPR